MTRALGCPVHFGAEATELLVGPDQLALPVRGADPYLLALVTRHADDLLGAAGAVGRAAGAGRAVLLQRLPNGAPTVTEVAEISASASGPLPAVSPAKERRTGR